MSTEFMLQYSLTLSTIVLIPLMLWMGKKRNMRKTTYVVFALLIAADLAAYFMMEDIVAYLYLAAITAISILFVKSNKQEP